MVNPYKSLGFSIGDDPSELIALSQRVLPDIAIGFEGSDVSYAQWTGESGAELWLQFSDGELVGVAPHYAGEARMLVILESRVVRPNEPDPAGAFHGWVLTGESDADYKLYPIVFDVPDFQRFNAMSEGATNAVQIAAFASEIEVFDSEETFTASDSMFASRSFIPLGLFSMHADYVPASGGMVRGHVVRAAEKRNDLTGEPFYWALVHSFGGFFDVVVDPELLERDLEVGNVVKAGCWLSGRPMAEE